LTLFGITAVVLVRCLQPLSEREAYRREHAHDLRATLVGQRHGVDLVVVDRHGVFDVSENCVQFVDDWIG
jgi:hypothetical protein